MVIERRQAVDDPRLRTGIGGRPARSGRRGFPRALLDLLAARLERLEPLLERGLHALGFGDVGFLVELGGIAESRLLAARRVRSRKKKQRRDEYHLEQACRSPQMPDHGEVPETVEDMVVPPRLEAWPPAERTNSAHPSAGPMGSGAVCFSESGNGTEQ